MRPGCGRDAQRIGEGALIERGTVPPQLVGSLHLDETRTAPRRAHREGSPDWREVLPIFGGEPGSRHFGARLAAGADVKLAEDRRDVVIDRLARGERRSTMSVRAGSAR